MILAGVDLAWRGNKNRTAVAFGRLSQNRLVLEDMRCEPYSADAILKELTECASLWGICIDAPLIIRNQKGQRECEKKVGRQYGSRKASCHTSNLTLYPEPDSVRLSNWLAAEGFHHIGTATDRWQLECYPHPALIEIFGLDERLLYKKGPVSQKKKGQRLLGRMLQDLSKSNVLQLVIPRKCSAPFDESHICSLRGSQLKRNEDMLDSVVCLYVAGLYASGVTNSVYGDVTEGYIYIPKKRCIDNVNLADLGVCLET